MSVVVQAVTVADGAAIVHPLAEVLVDCVAGGASVSFLLPFDRERAVDYWCGVLAGAAQGERVVLVAVDDEADDAVLGTVQVVLAAPENQPHRGEIAKLLVHRRARRRGVADALMRAAEDVALAAGRTLLVLDTASAEAERVYDRLGWVRVGVVPGYALLPDGAPCDTVIFYKQLARTTGNAPRGAPATVPHSVRMRRPFLQQDVFTAVPYFGNALAVVLDGAGLTDDEMQRFARWTNLSETTFLLPPTVAGADYKVRIFTPVAELPFAGHPTLGSCHAWLRSGGVAADADVVVQECAVGLVRVRRWSDGGLAFAAPPMLHHGAVDEELVARLTSILGIAACDVVDSQWVDNGPGWVAVMLADADAVLALQPGFVGDLKVGVVGPYAEGSPFAYEVRAFFPKDGATVEDPVTGSLNASLAQWLLGTDRVVAPYVASQGTAMGRAGRVHVERDDAGDVWIGGHVVTCIEGTVEL